MDAKTKAIVAHLTPIGWIIALVINMGQKEEMASYYIRQTLGLYLASFALGILNSIPVLGWIIWAVGGIIVFGILADEPDMVHFGRDEARAMGRPALPGLV